MDVKSLQFCLVLLSAAAVSAQTPAASKPKPAASKAAPSKPATAKTAPVKSAPAKKSTPKAAPAAGKSVESSAAQASLPNPELDKPVISVGGQKMSAREFETFIAALPEQIQLQARGPMRRQVAEQIVRVKVMADEARRKGLNKDRMIQAKLQFQEENLLAGELYQSMVKSAAISEGDLRRYFVDHKSEFEQAEAKHVLIRFKGSPVPLKEGQKELTEEEALAKANEVRKRIEGGEEFAKVAKEVSDDTGSGPNGGALGKFKRGSMVPAFETAVFAMKEGELSQPVKTQFGYHVIQVDKLTAQNFEDVRQDLERRLKPDVARKEMELLREQAQVTIDEAYFGSDPALAAPPAPAAPGAAPAPPAAAPAQPGQPAAPARPAPPAPAK